MAPRIEALFRSALRVINPRTLMEANLKNDPILSKKVHLIGFGKGAAGMASGVISSVGDRKIENGIISVPIGTFETMKKSERLDLWPNHKNVEIFEVAKNNLPDEKAAMASAKILEYCQALKEGMKILIL